MSFYTFCLFSPAGQLYWVLKHGAFLANRCEKGCIPLFLYHVPNEGRGFFVELGVDKQQDCFVVLRSFSDSEALADYVHLVKLPMY